MMDFESARERMVNAQIARRGVRDARTLTAMRSVPREEFVLPEYREFAYEDSPLSIGEGQTISQPYIVGLMLEAAELHPGDRVLEVGAGCGYASAIISRIAAQVYAVERIAPLADAAQQRLQRLGFHNIALRTGDGTEGWPEQAPFDAIIVSAGGPEAPPALKQQLAIGGRLIIPVGNEERRQTLLKIVRCGEQEFEQETLAAVLFVPLIGAQGWSEDGTRSATNHQPAAKMTVPQMIAAAGEPLPPLEDPRFGALFDRFAGCRVVLLGESSHGTSEFYRARAAITRRLIEQHGFNIVAVEADWPDAASINRYINHQPFRHGNQNSFQRFPSWMWRNVEVESFVAWLRVRNAALAPAERTGFYGLDIYNMHASITAVLAYLSEVDPEAAEAARQRYGCLTPWQNDPATYGRAVLSAGYAKCEQDVIRQCRELLQKELDYAVKGSERFLDAAQNARLIASAERYYRVMYYGGAASWNLRDTHMFETLQHVLAARGPTSKAVIWAHNSHIGDARHTEMGQTRGELNIGQLCREHFGDSVALIGFGTHTGTVAAASDWDGEMEIKRVLPSRSDSVERLFHDSGVSRMLLDLRDIGHTVLRQRMSESRLERFIGVIYRPETELMSHYSEVSLPRQFDAYVWFDETSAVTPLPTAQIKNDHSVPDTFPFAV
ncbi:MAG TPA: protein-L-isoaspartate(D-aspartate) O-methyltransferase [Oxalicibacterium sp.]|nr:protein-L-isoaspartate(D-aspartate) O-methyltransferase [Oxalicibacterium sp.]